MLKKPLFTRKNQDCTAKNQIGNIVFNYRFTGNSRIYKPYSLIFSTLLVLRLLAFPIQVYSVYTVSSPTHPSKQAHDAANLCKEIKTNVRKTGDKTIYM